MKQVCKEAEGSKNELQKYLLHNKKQKRSPDQVLPIMCTVYYTQAIGLCNLHKMCDVHSLWPWCTVRLKYCAMGVLVLVLTCAPVSQPNENIFLFFSANSISLQCVLGACILAVNEHAGELFRGITVQ